MTIWNRLTALGPAIIVASVVLGPGSILTSSKVGCQYGYQMVWILISAVVLMIGMTALAAYVGAFQNATLCQGVADRWGRPAAVAVGILMFVIIACFQSSNNAAILATLEGFRQPDASGNYGPPPSLAVRLGTLVVLNGVLIGTLFGFRNLYRPLERLMMLLVMAMLVAFGINLFFARPDLGQAAGGLVPKIPDTVTAGGGNIWALMGLVATTFSVAGAFYQSYLVREKGWNQSQVRLGLWDSITGISLLGLISLIIMLTSAAALHGVISVEELKSVTDVARQLEPLFGQSATLLFAVGLFAAALSSFLGNALIGGTILSDGLGWGASMSQSGPRNLTVVALLVGMVIASYTAVAGENAVDVIVVAQALTVLGIPLLAALLLYFGWKARRQGNAVPLWVLTLASIGMMVTLVLAARTVLLLVG